MQQDHRREEPGIGPTPQIRCLTPADQEFPELLRQLRQPLARLWVCGSGTLSRPWVGVVGARAADPVALLAAAEIAQLLASCGLGVLSGGAMGVDAAAHRAALQASGCTAAVMAGGVDVPGPACNAGLFREMLAAGSLLASERPPGSAPLPRAFPRRNHLIAALSRALIVVQARLGSGSLITAAQAQRLGRPVLVVPGGWQDRSREGCTQLLRQGALPFTHPGELGQLLAGLGLTDLPPAAAQDAVDQPPRPGRPPEDLLLQALASGPAGVEVLAGRTGLPAPQLLARLTELELCGSLTSLPGGLYAATGRP